MIPLMTPAHDSALLVIDVQESFRQRPDDWAAMSGDDTVAAVSDLVDHARERGDHVVWITHSEPGSGGVFDPAGGFVRVVDALVPQPADIQVTKTTINAFTSTDLHARLTALGVRRLVVCGIRTEQCCETTTRVGADLGFEVDFVIDATTTSGIPGLSREEIIERTGAVLAARGFARVLTSAEVLGG